MPRKPRHKTKYVGVTYETQPSRTRKGEEKVYFIRYRKGGKQVEEVAGRQFEDDMTPARASNIRAKRIEGAQLSNAEARKAREAAKNRPTLTHLWSLYGESRPAGSASATDRQRWNQHLVAPFGDKEPAELTRTDTDRLRITLLKRLSPQTVKHVLSLLSRVINFGANRGIIAPLHFKIEFPEVDNVKTEDLDSDQLRRLWEVLETTPHRTCAMMMKIALYTGMRRGEIFKLKWSDVDTFRGFITIRDPKGGTNQRIPLTAEVEGLLASIPRIDDEEHIFPARGGGPRQEISKHARAIMQAAGIPGDFRPFHGLRHVYASMMASSGKVDLYQLQRLLTHKSPQMTQRYAHLRDDALKQAASMSGGLLSEAMKTDDDQEA